MPSALAIKFKGGIQEFREITKRGKDALDKQEELVQKANGTFTCKAKEGKPDAAKTRDKSENDRK
jgi:hypothetical protein